MKTRKIATQNKPVYMAELRNGEVQLTDLAQEGTMLWCKNRPAPLEIVGDREISENQIVELVREKDRVVYFVSPKGKIFELETRESPEVVRELDERFLGLVNNMSVVVVGGSYDESTREFKPEIRVPVSNPKGSSRFNKIDVVYEKKGLKDDSRIVNIALMGDSKDTQDESQIPYTVQLACLSKDVNNVLASVRGFMRMVSSESPEELDRNVKGMTDEERGYTASILKIMKSGLMQSGRERNAQSVRYYTQKIAAKS